MYKLTVCMVKVFLVILNTINSFVAAESVFRELTLAG